MKKLLYISLIVFTGQQLHSMERSDGSTEEEQTTPIAKRSSLRKKKAPHHPAKKNERNEDFTLIIPDFLKKTGGNTPTKTEDSEESLTPSSEQRKRIIKDRKELQRTGSIPKASLAILDVTIKIPHVAFAPTILPCLLKLISEEKKRIEGACFEFDDMTFAQAWVDAQEKRKIRGSLTIDRHQLKEKAKIKKVAKLLSQNGISVYQNSQRYKENNVKQKDGTYLNYGTTNRDTSGKFAEKKFFETMHHKFFIFKKNEVHGSLVITGSFNWTENANDRNWENIVILNDPLVIEEFRKEMTELANHRELVKL